MPMWLLTTLLVLTGLYVVTQADRYGHTYDEAFQDEYGTATYRWYFSLGEDTSFLNFDPVLHMPEHGPVFEFLVAFAQFTFGGADHWYVRALVCGIGGAAGIVGMALCGYELGGWWGSFLAAAGLALYPRYTGAVFNNSKDIPLAVAMIFILWMTLRLLRRWNTGREWILDSLLLGVVIGIGVSVRINALLWLGVVGLAALVWWARHGRAAVREKAWWPELRKQLLAGLAIGAATYLTIIVTWPYIALNPVSGLPDVLKNMSAYPWDGNILFNGELVHASTRPRDYVPRWLLVASPLPTVLLALLGTGLIVADLVRRRLTDLRVLAGAALFFVPFVLLLVTRPVLYNGPRHFLFIVPGLILLGAYAVQRTAGALATTRAASERARYVVAALLVVDLVGGYAHSVVATVRLYPYEYVYFSPIVGGYADARGKWEGDYWGSCQRSAMDWLLANRFRYPVPNEPPSIGGFPYGSPSIPPGWSPVYAAEGDYSIDYEPWPLPPGYEVIHTVEVDGLPLCNVGRRMSYS
ncbi:hypothetical protein Val02_51290 [Virgisporangium aliadipatigenens]|uniref:Glycosyltransferase RgtA/B/C/D-like domain-containing protein n=1 Tax=Virgisporangium aliadipatigenens TaxID=741659 RepID=A0A8J3YQ24_9ACTN|nr:hypothetical protein Val02_51290 [Virgisporangium aliadipatigenens]